MENERPQPPPRDPAKPYLCGQCGRDFKLKIHLGSHMKRTHGPGWLTWAPGPRPPRAPYKKGSRKAHGAGLRARLAEIDAATRMPGAGLDVRVVGEQMTCHLTTGHEINGRPYGPGVVVVPAEIGRTLMESETRVRASEAELFGPQRSYMVNMRTMQAIPVATQHFHQAWTG